MLALLFLSITVSASAGRQSAKTDACLSIAAQIEAAGSLEEPQRTSAAYMLCLKQRPRASFLGVTNAVQDCREFAHAYQLAKQFGRASFSAAELCATLHVYAGDAARLAAGVAEAKNRKSNELDHGVALIDRAACETHMRKIDQLRLDRQEAAGIVQADCPKRFNVQASVCAQAGKLFAAGKLAGVCELLSPHRPPPVDMVGVCKRAASKVGAVGLEGEALRRAAADLCLAELKTLAPQVPQQRTMAGCNFFAKKLEGAQQKGPMDVPRFCMALGGGRQTTAATTKVAAPAAPEPPVAVQPQPHASTAEQAKTGVVAALQTLTGADGGAVSQTAEVAEDARGSMGGDASVVDQGANQQPTRSPGRETAEANTKLSTENQASNDFLTGFLENYAAPGSKAFPSTVAPPAQNQRMAVEVTETDPKPTEARVSAAPAQEAAVGTLPSAQPDAGQALTQLAGSFSALSPPDGLLPGVAGEKAPAAPPPPPVSNLAVPPPTAPANEHNAAHDDGENDFDGAVASFLDNSQ